MLITLSPGSSLVNISDITSGAESAETTAREIGAGCAHTSDVAITVNIIVKMAIRKTILRIVLIINLPIFKVQRS